MTRKVIHREIEALQRRMHRIARNNTHTLAVQRARHKERFRTVGQRLRQRYPLC